MYAGLQPKKDNGAALSTALRMATSQVAESCRADFGKKRLIMVKKP
jgi:hypothetical protein